MDYVCMTGAMRDEMRPEICSLPSPEPERRPYGPDTWVLRLRLA
jgi:hypothetical protein